MQGRKFQETGGVLSAIRRGFLGTENDTDAGRSCAAVERHYSDRLLARIIHDDLSRKGGVARDKREKRDLRDV
jgi:hypothetical protein